MTSDVDHGEFVVALSVDGNAGGVPDGEIVGSTSEDWQPLLDVLGRSSWSATLVEHEDEAFPTKDEQLAEYWQIRVEVTPDIHANFFDWGIIGFDIDLGGITSQAELDTLVGFLRELGSGMQRTIAMRPEGTDPDKVAIRYDHTADTFEVIEPLA